MQKKADSSLSNAEKEDREIERLINKKPAPSRKNREKRGPKHDNRRRKMETDPDPDLSLASSDAYSFDNFLGEDMVVRTSGYHGIVERGNTGDMEESLLNTRVFDPLTEDDYKKLVSAAKEAMKQPWFKTGWGDDKTDAVARAALDQSIATASNSVYAQRIDSMTYNLLLGKLLGEEIDQSVDAFFDEGLGLSRSEFKMDDKTNILHLASKLRMTQPRLALDLVRSIRKAADPMPGVIDDKLKSEMDKKLKELLQAITDEDIEAFGESLKETSSLLPKTASRTAAEFLEFKSLADMSASDLTEFFEKARKDVEKSKKELQSDNVEEFMISFNSLLNTTEDAAKRSKQGSVRVNLATLIRVASTSEEARTLLLPVLAAAKKKLKKPSKTSGKEKPEKDDKKPASKKDDKKPAGKKDDKKPAGKKPADKKDPKSNLAPPFKKKASFESDDLDW